MTKAKDDLEAVREVAATLEQFSNEERERIIRWAREKVGMSVSESSVSPTTGRVGASPAPASPSASQTGGARDIRSFIQEKDPKNDSQLAVVVAYYYQFVAPQDQRRDSITSADLVEACRQSDRARPLRPAQTLVNAYGQGLLNRGEQGHYSLNPVGENLVAMVLPDESGATGARRTASRRPAGKKAGQETLASKATSKTKSKSKKATHGRKSDQ